MAALCEAAATVIPQPAVAAPAGACQVLEPIASADVTSKLNFCVCSTKSGLGQGKAGLQSCCVMLTGASIGRMARFSGCMCWHVPFQPFWMLHFSMGTPADEVKSPLVTPVFKKGDRCDPTNYLFIAVGEPLYRLYPAILNRHIVSWAEEAGRRALMPGTPPLAHIHGASDVCFALPHRLLQIPEPVSICCVRGSQKAL